MALLPSAILPQATVDPARLARIPARMGQFVEDGQIAGAVMLLAHRGEIVLHEAVGYRDVERRDRMTTSTVFQVQSMTKPITAVGILVLAEEGRLRLNDPVEKYLPEFRNQMLARATGIGSQTEMAKLARSITIRDLLTHSSGMPHGHHVYTTAPDAETLEEVVASNAQQPLESEPGTRFRYSSLGFETLGRIIEVASGKPYEEFLQQQILVPLGMRASFFIAAPKQCGRIATIYDFRHGVLTPLPGDPCRPFTYPNPAGGMFSTTEDMFAFYQMTLQGGSYEGGRILSRASVDAMTAPHVTVPLGGSISAFGLGWWVVQEPVGTIGLPLQSKGSFGHGGYWGTLGWVDPETDLVGVFLIHYNPIDLGPRGMHVRAYAELFATMAAAAIQGE